MKDHLLALFAYNDTANRRVITKLVELPDSAEAIRLLSHLVHSQDKWLARLRKEPDANRREWFGPSFTLDELPQEWERSLQGWQAFLTAKSEAEILGMVQWEGYDGGQWEATLYDIALQLCLHGVHHRAQIQTLVRDQGLQPDFIDYIGTRYRKLP